MKTLLATDVVPLGDLKAHASRLLDEVAARRHAVVVTRNGRPAGVLLHPADFDRLVERERLMEDIAAGEADIDAGRAYRLDEVRAWLAALRAEETGKASA